jgi:hypothetical protein
MTKRNGIDRAIEAGATFDFVTPILSLLSGRTHLCTLREDQNLADGAMKAAGISQHQRAVRGDYYNFDVDRDNGKAALEALAAAGCAGWKV